MYPALTTAGREFKLSAYNAATKQRFWFPFSMQAYFGYTTLPVNSDEYPSSSLTAPHYQFLGFQGKLFGNLGASIAFDYNAGASDAAFAPSEVRYAKRNRNQTQDMLYGFLVTNRIGYNDVWSSAITKPLLSKPLPNIPQPAHGYGLAPVFTKPVLGGGAYAYINSLMYFEMSVFRSDPRATTDTIRYAAPYVRAALNRDIGDTTIAFGLTHIASDITQVDTLNGAIANVVGYNDTALDFMYEVNGRIHQFGIYGAWVMKSARYTDQASNNKEIVHSRIYRAAVGYSAFHLLGVRLGVINIDGEADALWYSSGANSNNVSGSPRTSLMAVEIDYLASYYVKTALQLYFHDYFNGAQKNYDGIGRNATDNDAIFFTVGITL